MLEIQHDFLTHINNNEINKLSYNLIISKGFFFDSSVKLDKLNSFETPLYILLGLLLILN